MQTVNHAPHKSQCILCGNSDSSLYLVSRRAESHEYLRCNGCGLVFDKEARNGGGVTFEHNDELFESGSQAFRKEYVEDADISDKKGNLYPRFSYTNNASIEKDIVSRALRSLNLHGNLADRKGNIRLLEVGCATGFLCAGLKEYLKEADVTGIDPSPISIKKARRRTSEVRFEIGTLDTVDVGKEKYDAAFCIGNLMLHRNPLDTLCRIYSALKPGGDSAFRC